nr:unnamed protein product [Digitaria exilis]
MSVVGFDVGNDTLVAAAARQRGIDVLLNAESKRESPAAVAFSHNARLIGSHAASASASHAPFSSVKRLLVGATGRDPASSLLGDLPRFPFPVSFGADGGALVHADHMGRRIEFSPTHLLSMLLGYLKQLAEADLGGAPVADCVISVPCYFTLAQRRAYLDAAAVAGLRPLRLMHDLAATALGYGLYRSDLGGAGAPTRVAFVDVGQCDTQVAVVSFDALGMKVLSHGFDADLGGRDFDEVLFEHFAEEFRDRYKIDVGGNVKASMRLRAACEKAKKVLSANAEAVVNIECLMEEKDVRGVIRREEFEKLSAGLLERVVEPCKKAVADSGIGLERLHSVELVGSGSRVPAIAKVLAGFFRREPSRTLNASESVGGILRIARFIVFQLIDDSQRNANSADHMELDSSGDDMGDKSRSEMSIQRQDLPIAEYIYGAMSKQELLEAQEQEQQLAYQDKLVERTKERKNALESYVYDTRNKLSERYRSFATDSEREEISVKLQHTEEWLYEEGDDETEAVYCSKLDELKKVKGNSFCSFCLDASCYIFFNFCLCLCLYLKLVDPIENRCKDDEMRAEVARELLKCIVDHRMAAKSLSASERDAVDNECNKAEQWLREGLQLQESLPKNVDPVLWSYEIKRQERDLDMYVFFPS